MLPRTDTYTETQSIDLFGDTGIQFLDLGVALDPRREPAGQFALLDNGLLARLFEDKDDRLYYESEPKVKQQARPHPALQDVSMEESLRMLNGIWLPAPFFRYLSSFRFDQGPNNWARIRIVKLDTPDAQGNTHRITLAFDTRVMPRREGVAYLAPNDDDLRNGQTYRLALHLSEMHWFLDQVWIKEWLTAVFRERCELERRELEDVQRELNEQRHMAHYLNLLSLLRGPAPTTHPNREPKLAVPLIRLKPHHAVGSGTQIPVDLVLDVGNSRCCGILVELPSQNSRGLHSHSHLALRDLSAPEHIYDDPFESRIEFAKIDLGNEQYSRQSGRHDAFTWVSMARVGPEAAKLAAQRHGTEGSTGLSSPKRYLWDKRPFEQVWRLNTATIKGHQEPMAALRPVADLIDDFGEALYSTGGVESVFEAKYSRASLMSFMLHEVFAQAVMQINSVLYRRDKENASTSRWLRSVILTVPPSMPQVERSEFRNRVQQALGLLWKGMGWHTGSYNENPLDDKDEAGKLSAPLPTVTIKWDEATCAQLVYLYTEVAENFGGHPEEFFDALARPGRADRERITVASLDIGGGTTDLVINEYSLQRQGAGAGSNVPIIPEQRFRDGFRVAGDDIVLDVIRLYVLPSLEAALGRAEVPQPAQEVEKLCGERSVGASELVLRQQLTLQALYPLALKLLSVYEDYDLEAAPKVHTHTWAEWLGEEQHIRDAVQNYVARKVSEARGVKTNFNLDDIRLSFNPAELHGQFLRGAAGALNISKTLIALAEIVAHYECDVLLLTGRPSRLPGVQALMRSLACMPAGRILPMQNYRTGAWFPFHKGGLIDDPKTTASVGAMLCRLSEQGRLPNFYYSSSALKPRPLIRYFGQVDNNNLIKKDDLLFSDIKTATLEGLPLEDGCIELPTDEEGKVAPYTLHGDARLGYRQLTSERWPAAAIYRLGFAPDWLARHNQRRESNASVPEAVAQVYFRIQRPSEAEQRQGLISDRLEVESVEGRDGVSISKSNIHFELNTLPQSGLGHDSYWLDSGSVKG